MQPKMQSHARMTTLISTLLLTTLSSFAASSAFQLKFVTQPAGSIVGANLTNVTVQILDKVGTNVAQSGTAINLALTRGSGLNGVTNLISNASGQVTFTNLKVMLAGNNDALLVTASGLKSATSTGFIVSKGTTATAVSSSSTNLVYGQSITFTAAVSLLAPATGTPSGTVTFKDSGVTLGAGTLNSSGVATFSTNRISAATAGRTITAVYGGDSNFSGSTSSNFLQAVSKLALTVSGITASNKVYNGTTSAALNFSNATLGTILAGDTVTLNSTAAKGVFADKTVGTNKTVAVAGLALAGASAANYSVTAPTAPANITPRSLALTAKGANKIYDGTSNAVVTLADNRLAGDAFTNNCAAAAFANKNVGTAISVNVSGLTITGADAGNYVLTNLTALTSANITPAALTVSGIIASNKIYDATTTAPLNFSAAKLATIFGGDAVTLNATNAKGAFASKAIGTGKTVTVSSLAITGANAGNYTLTLPAATANITARSLTLTATGANKIYDGTTAATVKLADNRVVGDALTDSYASAAFTNKNAGTNILINVSGLAITGTDSANYALTGNNTAAAANITKATLTVSGILASNKVYDATTTATLIFTNATLVTLLGGDTVTLTTTAAKGVFASKTVATGKTVAVSGLTIAGTGAGNYTLTQPTTTASITARNLTIAAKGANKVYDGTMTATVTLADNRVAGDVLTDSYASAAFTNQNAGTNILINVSGLAATGTDSANYVLTGTNTTAAASIAQAALTVAANSLSRAYATTNPPLTAAFSGFVPGESVTNSDLLGAPALTTTAKTNSVVGPYPITITKGTLVSVNYALKFINGILTVTKADTTALLSTTINPALTNQNITFAAKVTPLVTTVLPPTGIIQFKSNGTNKLGNAVNLASGQANLTTLAGALGNGNVIITAEYSDPAGNFNASTNTLSQLVVTTTTPPPCKLSLAPASLVHDGMVTASLAGTAGQTYVIQATSDLINWVSISTNVADAAGLVSLIDSNAVAYPSRFYRAYSP